MFILALLFPFLGFVIATGLGRWSGKKGAALMSCVFMLLTNLVACLIWIYVFLGKSELEITIFDWISIDFLSLTLYLMFDSLTANMMVVVTTISALVHIYSVSYMSEDPAESSRKTLYWDKLSNSGDALKLIIPSNSRKTISGWSNYPCMVTSYKIYENIMGYRGSKSNSSRVNYDSSLFFVKEQRVYDSWVFINLMKNLRYTLMGFERNYQIRILSNQLYKTTNGARFLFLSCLPKTQHSWVETVNSKKFYSTIALPGKPLKIDPWFWTGFIDAEGSFLITIRKSKTHKLGWMVELGFQMGLHERDFNLLLLFQQALGVGKIHSSLKKANFVIATANNLTNLVNHLKIYPLCTQKAADFYLIEQALELVKNKLHLTVDGLNKLVNIKAALNTGLSDNLKSEFKNYSPVEKPVIKTANIPNPNWISGFVAGEGKGVLTLDYFKA